MVVPLQNSGYLGLCCLILDHSVSNSLLLGIQALRVWQYSFSGKHSEKYLQSKLAA